VRPAPSIDSVNATGTADPTDLLLVRRAQAGDAEAFGELVERNRRAVYRAALAAVGSAAEADDVAQDAFVAAFRKLGSFRGESSFKTWLLTITWRRAIDRRQSVARWMRRIASRADDSEEWDVVEHLPAPAASQEDEFIAADLQREIRAQIATLPRKLRDALLLAASGEYSYDEIARMLEIPVGTLKWRVSEARRMVKQKLGTKGIGQ
jgi:RNA polymerase sigma-70 factor (ECF subfamily)